MKISPSMMCADFLKLQEELDVFKQHKIDYLHIDIMDGHYVPNYTLGADIAKAMGNYSGIPLDFHLMVEESDKFVDIFCENKGCIYTFHPETSRHPVRTIQKIKDLGCQAGIAIDPGMSVNIIKHLLPLVDVVCVMTVNPGYAGQKLIPFCIDKISELKEFRAEMGLNFKIEVDGNVSWENIPKMIQAGSDILVVGTSSIFSKTETRASTITRLKELISQ